MLWWETSLVAAFIFTVFVFNMFPSMWTSFLFGVSISLLVCLLLSD